MENEQLVFGLCWYQSEQWSRLLEISEDADDLEETYEEWRKNAHKTIQEFQANGKKIKKVKINLEQLLFWCNEKILPVNGKSRAEYVTYVMQQKNQKP
jgi:hypothetical protein